MKLSIHLDAGETYSNIGMAKALIESRLSVDDVREIVQYLKVFVKNAPIFVNEEALRKEREK